MTLLMAALALSVAAGPDRAGATSQNAAATDDPIVARVDDVAIYASDLAFAAETLGKDPKDYDTPALRDALVTFVTDTVLLGRKAEKQGLADDRETQRRLRLAHWRVLAEKVLRVTAEAATTEEAVRRTYDEAAAKAGPPPMEYRLRAIVLKFKDGNNPADVEEARARAEIALARLGKGEDFAAVANAMTDSVTAKDNGGALGYMTEVAMGGPFAEAVTKLEIGRISPIIRSPIGWHIVKLEDKQSQKLLDFESARAGYAQLVAKRAQFELVQKLRADAKIERMPGELAAPAPEAAR